MNLYDITVNDYKHQPVKLEKYKGSCLLIVNTATKCGFTKQYDGLQELYDELKAQGFIILDFPCNQFLRQAPGTEAEIHSFCEMNFGISFPQFEKIKVNGKEESPLYTYLKSQLPGRITWNFNKFLVDKAGNVVKRYDSKVTPEALKEDILKLL